MMNLSLIKINFSRRKYFEISLRIQYSNACKLKMVENFKVINKYVNYVFGLCNNRSIAKQA